MKKLIPAYVRVPLLFFIVGGAMEFFIDSGNKPAFMVYPMVSVFLFVFLFVLIAVEITISAVDNITYQLLSEEQKQQLEQEEALGITEQQWYKNLMQKLTKSKPISAESELILNHDYDGIKELDNDLPPWWKYLFIVTIIWGFAYLGYYHVFGGDNQEMELQKDMAQAQIALEEYKKTAPDLMNAESATVMTDAADLAKGKSIFETNCAACHKADGGGQIGPNLTDEQWILGGGIKNVFHTISEGGRDGKGMVAWKTMLKPTEIQQVSSYVLSLKGTNPADAKAAEGEIWIDEASAVENTPAEETK